MVDLKPYVATLTKKKVLVYGLGRTGLSAVKALLKAGAKVVAGDDNIKAVEEAKSLGAEILDENAQDYSEFDFMLLSPGIPLTHPEPHRVVKLAQAAGIEIIGDIELYHRNGLTGVTIGVTGTNGKTTTSHLIHHILTKCGRKAVLGGNMGRPVLDIDVYADFGKGIKNKDFITVLEMSSYQIDLCPTFRPDISVILNITSDHIDRHGTIEGYAAVKQKIAELHAPDEGGSKVENEDDSVSVARTVIICTDDIYTSKIYDYAREQVRAWSKDSRSNEDNSGSDEANPDSAAAALSPPKVIAVSVLRKEDGGVYVKDGILIDDVGDSQIQVGDVSVLTTLKGGHNHQNLACAYAAARALGLSSEEIFEAMKSFEGLQHRQFLVRVINGVGYVNDSKATNAHATSMALDCHNNIYWIVGGRKKDTGLDGLEIFAQRIKHAFLIGEAAQEFGKWMDIYGIDHSLSMTLEEAVKAAHNLAQKERGQPGGSGVVLFSPSCSSFDQFKSFEHRGQQFTDIVMGLDEDI